MARKPDELKLYIEALAKEKNFTPEQTKLAIAAATGEIESLTKEQLTQVIAPLIDLTVGRHGDYSREMDSARTEKTKAVSEYNALKKWKTDEIDPLLARTAKERDAAVALKAKYEAQFGPLDETQDLGDGTTRTAKGQIVDTAKLEELKANWKTEAKNEMAREVLGFERSRSALAIKHARYFKGQPLDTAELLDIMGKAASEGQNITLEQAYAQKYGEQITAADADAVKAKEAELVEKGRKLEREQNAKAAAGNGAVVPEGTGAFWDQLNAAEKKTDVKNLSEADRASAFGADLRTRLTENEQKFQTETS